MTRRPALLLAAAALASSARAQIITTSTRATLALRWSDTGNHNGLLEPGEDALVALDVSFTDQFAIGTFAPCQQYCSGTMLGIGAGLLDVDGAGGTEGLFNIDPLAGRGLLPRWDLTSTGSGYVNAAGTGVRDIQFIQFPPYPELATTTNPVPGMWLLQWTPSSYAARSVTFAVAGRGIPTFSVYFRLDPLVGTTAFVAPDHVALGSIAIPIVPAPASAAALAFAAWLAGRRRPRVQRT